jgi:hypothetical protein
MKLKKNVFLCIAVISILSSNVCSAATSIKIPGTENIPVGLRFEAKLSADGLKAPLKTEVTAGKLPFGLSLTPDGTITGTPVAVVRTSAKIKVTDSADKSVEEDIPFAVTDAKFRLIYGDLPVAKVGKKTTLKIQGQGGAPPYLGCKIERARTFYNGGAAKFGAKAPTEEGAPVWFSVSDDCSVTVSPDKEAIVIFIISANDSAGASAKEFYAIRATTDPSKPGWLEAKAREYNKDYQDRFSPYGLTVEIDPKGAYYNYGDSAMWTGTYLAGAAYYYAVTKEDYARANLDKSLAATTRLREITGVPGLIGRAYENDEWVGKSDHPHIEPNEAQHRYLVKDGPYKGWRVLTTASRDQYTGVFWGNAAVYNVVQDPAFKKRAAENIVSMATHIWDHKMRVVDPDGKMTNHGLMSGYAISDSEGLKHYDPYNSPARIQNGYNAALLLNWFDLAANVAPDEKTREMWRTRYINLISKEPNPEPGRDFERNYLSFLKKLYVYGESFNGYYETAWFNLNLLFNNYYDLVWNENNENLRKKYREVLRFLWEDKTPMENGCDAPTKRRAGREKNPHFTWQYLAAQGGRDPEKIFDAVSALIIFPRGPKTTYKIVDPIDIPTVPGHPTMSCEPVPVQYRMPEDFFWQRAPYGVNTSWPQSDDGRQFAGVDVITPYWMGRYFGFVPGNI